MYRVYRLVTSVPSVPAGNVYRVYREMEQCINQSVKNLSLGMRYQKVSSMSADEILALKQHYLSKP